MTPFPWHAKKCAGCHQLFKADDTIRVTSKGTLHKIGGKGLYRDGLNFRSQETIEHETCAVAREQK